MNQALDRADIERYSRHLLLPQVGMPGQSRLAEGRVLVVGAGGLGSPVLLYLAAAGVGTIGVVDDDTVALSNLQRQVLHATASVGQTKTTSAALSIARLNPGVAVVEHAVRLEPANATDLVRGYDIVVDGSDNFPTRYAVADACAQLRLPHVWGSVLRFDGQASVWWAGRGPCYRCAFPQPPPPDAVPSCDAAGVLGVVCASIGAVLAGETLKLLLGIGEPLVGRLLVHDALRQSWDAVTVRADPTCPACGEHPRVAEPVHDVPTGLAPPASSVGTVEPAALTAYLAAEPRAVLVDVRGEAERALVAIPGSVRIPLEDFRSGAAYTRPELADSTVPVILYCRSGPRSQEAALLAEGAGYSSACVLTGGVLRWVEQVAPDQPRY